MRSVEAELGLGSSVVSKVLSGAIRPQISYVLMIARAIGLSPDEFFHLAYPKKLRTISPLLQQALEVEGLSGDEGEALADLDARIEAAVRRAMAVCEGVWPQGVETPQRCAQDGSVSEPVGASLRRACRLDGPPPC
jgi:transcriptional regulator with XRE-family HTH domain